MGVVTRPDSRFFWLNLERPRQRPLRVSTKIPVSPANKRVAQDLYLARMAELAGSRLYDAPKHEAPIPARPLVASDDGAWCYIYFVQRRNTVKIGKASDVRQRLKALQTASDEPLALLAAIPAHIALEAVIHKRFKAARTHGEWFRITEELRAFITAVQSGSNPVALLMEPAAIEHK